MSDHEPVSVLAELTQFTLAVMAANQSGDLDQIQNLIDRYADRLSSAQQDANTLLDEKGMVQRYPALFKNVRSLQNYRTRNTGPPYIKVGRQVYYRIGKVDAWITEQENSTDTLNILLRS